MNTLRRHFALVLFGVAASTVIAYVVVGVLVRASFGPNDRPTSIVEPSLVGVAGEITKDGTQERVRIGDTEVTVDRRQDLEFGRISEGDLVLLGSHDGVTWYDALPPREDSDPAGCYRIWNRAWDEPDAIVFDGYRDAFDTRLGLRLPKADRTNNYGRPYPEGVYPMSTVFCVNDDGVVFGSVEGLDAPP